MKMKILRISVLALVILTAADAATAATEKIDSSPAGGRITVDGDPSDWDEIPVVYLQESLRVFGIAHDEKAVYLMFRFGDRNLASFVRTRGVMLWFNGDGKPNNKKEVFGVRYPGSKEIALELDRHARPESPAAVEESEDDTMRALRLTLTDLRQLPGELTVVRMGEKESMDEGGTDGLAAASSIEDGVFCYELRVPFSEIGGKVAATSAGKQREIALGVLIGGLTEAEEKELEDELDEHMDDQQRKAAARAARGSAGYEPRRRTGSMAGMAGMLHRDGAVIRRQPADSGIEWLSVSLPPIN